MIGEFCMLKFVPLCFVYFKADFFKLRILFKLFHAYERGSNFMALFWQKLEEIRKKSHTIRLSSTRWVKRGIYCTKMLTIHMAEWLVFRICTYRSRVRIPSQNKSCLSVQEKKTVATNVESLDTVPKIAGKIGMTQPIPVKFPSEIVPEISSIYCTKTLTIHIAKWLVFQYFHLFVSGSAH